MHKINIKVCSILGIILLIAIGIGGCLNSKSSKKSSIKERNADKKIQLDIPGAINVYKVNLHSIGITWGKVENAESYIIKYCEADNKENEYEIETDSRNYVLDKLFANTIYEIQIIAKCGQTESEPSEIKEITTATPTVSNYVILDEILYESGNVLLKWKPYETDDVNFDGTNVDIFYNIKIYDTMEGKYTTLIENIREPEYTYTGLDDLETKYIKIYVSEIMDGKSYKSDIINEYKTPLCKPIICPSITSVEGYSDSIINIKWNEFVTDKTNKDGSPVQIEYCLYEVDTENDNYKILTNNFEGTEIYHKQLETETQHSYALQVIITRDESVYYSEMSDVVSGRTLSKKENEDRIADTVVDADGLTKNQKLELARVVAQQIADNATGNTDLERVRSAARMVEEYGDKCEYTTRDPDYETAYGVFCKGVYTCAGTTRAMGLVLDCMGYEWSHINERQWKHQWCVLEMDGQIGWADAMGGIADYGEYPFLSRDVYVDENGVEHRLAVSMIE